MEEITANAQETSSVEPTSNDEFLGTAQDENLGEVESAEESPETSAEETETEVESPDAEASEATQEEDDSEYLPDEQEKEFPLEVLAKYAKRYGKTLEQVQADPQLANLIKDKINSDIEIKKARSAQEEPEESAEEPTLTPEPTQEERTRQMEQHFQTLDKYVEQVTDPVVAKRFNQEIQKAYSYRLPDGKPDLDKQAIESTKVFTKYTVNLLNTVLPDFLDSQLDKAIEKRYPDFGDMHEKSLYARAWEQVRKSDASFSKLPAYGPQEGEFGKLMEKAAAQIPNFQKMKFVDDNGKPLPKKQQAIEQFTLLARIATGQQVSPALVQKAAKTITKKANEAQQKRALGSALGAGQSKNAIGKSAGGDDLDAAMDSFIAQSKPFGKR